MSVTILLTPLAIQRMGACRGPLGKLAVALRGAVLYPMNLCIDNVGGCVRASKLKSEISMLCNC